MQPASMNSGTPGEIPCILPIPYQISMASNQYSSFPDMSPHHGYHQSQIPCKTLDFPPSETHVPSVEQQLDSMQDCISPLNLSANAPTSPNQLHIPSGIMRQQQTSRMPVTQHPFYLPQTNPMHQTNVIAQNFAPYTGRTDALHTSMRQMLSMPIHTSSNISPYLQQSALSASPFGLTPLHGNHMHPSTDLSPTFQERPMAPLHQPYTHAYQEPVAPLHHHSQSRVFQPIASSHVQTFTPTTEIIGFQSHPTAHQNNFNSYSKDAHVGGASMNERTETAKPSLKVANHRTQLTSKRQNNFEPYSKDDHIRGAPMKKRTETSKPSLKVANHRTQRTSKRKKSQTGKKSRPFNERCSLRSDARYSNLIPRNQILSSAAALNLAQPCGSNDITAPKPETSKPDRLDISNLSNLCSSLAPETASTETATFRHLQSSVPGPELYSGPCTSAPCLSNSIPEVRLASIAETLKDMCSSSNRAPLYSAKCNAVDTTAAVGINVSPQSVSPGLNSSECRNALVIGGAGNCVQKVASSAKNKDSITPESENVSSSHSNLEFLTNHQNRNSVPVNITSDLRNKRQSVTGRKDTSSLSTRHDLRIASEFSPSGIRTPEPIKSLHEKQRIEKRLVQKKAKSHRSAPKSKAGHRFPKRARNASIRKPAIHSDIDRLEGRENSLQESIRLTLRIKAPVSAGSPLSDDTQPPLTPRSIGDRSTPDAAILSDATKPEGIKHSKPCISARISPSLCGQRKQRGSLNLALNASNESTINAMAGTKAIQLHLRIRKPKKRVSRRISTNPGNSSKRISVPTEITTVLDLHSQRKAKKRGSLQNGPKEDGNRNDQIAEVPRVKGAPRQSKTAADRSALKKRPRQALLSDSAARLFFASALKGDQEKTRHASDVVPKRVHSSKLPSLRTAPVHDFTKNLRDSACSFDAELDNLRRNGELRDHLSESVRTAGESGSQLNKVCCMICSTSTSRDNVLVHPRFAAPRFFLCLSCYGRVDSRLKRAGQTFIEPIEDKPDLLLRRITFFVMIVESIIQGFPPSERDSRDLVKAFKCVTSRESSEILKRAKFIRLPYESVALLRVIMRKLGITIQRNRIRWRMQPVMLPTWHDLIEIIMQAIPPTLEDMVKGSTPAQRVWDSIFPQSKLETMSSAYSIISDLMGLIGVRVRHLCTRNSGVCQQKSSCEVQFDLLSVCSVMQRAAVMVSGTASEPLFRIWRTKVASRYLRATDTRLAHQTTVGQLPGYCSICAIRGHRRDFPFRYFKCKGCSNDICSVCISNVLGPSELAIACAEEYNCSFCRVDATVDVKLGRTGEMKDFLSAAKPASSVSCHNSSKPKLQLPMLLLSTNLRRRILLREKSSQYASYVGFAKFCEEANIHICQGGFGSSELQSMTFTFPTKSILTTGIPPSERCFRCKLPAEEAVPAGGRKATLNDDEPSILRCVFENCGVVMHRSCSPSDPCRRRRVGRPKWTCPRHRCQTCQLRDDSRLFKCRTCPLALCKDHVPKPCKVYVYSEKLFACQDCMGDLRAPRPCLVDKLPKRKKSGFIQSLNITQTRRKAINDKTAPVGMPVPYPGCLK